MSKKWDKNKHNQKTSPDHEEPACHNEMKWPSIYPVRIDPSAEDKERYAQEQRHRNAQLRIGVWLNRITAAGTLVGLCGLLYLWGTLKATQRAAGAAVDAAKASQQQVVAFEATESAQLDVSIGPEKSPGLLAAPTPAPGNSASIDWNIAVTNVGPTMGKELNFTTEIFEVMGTNGFYAEPPQYPFSNLRSDPSPIGPLIRANETKHFPYHTQLGGWQDLEGGKAIEVIYMQFSYVDIFGREDFAPVCVYFTAKRNGFVRCP